MFAIKGNIFSSIFIDKKRNCKRKETINMDRNFKFWRFKKLKGAKFEYLFSSGNYLIIFYLYLVIKET